MVFSSLTFLYIFLPLCLLAYYLAKNIKIKNIVLLAFSLVFYAVGEPKYIFLMVLTVLVDYVGGILIDRYRRTGLAKLCLGITAAITLGFLAVFKYAGFFTENVNSLFNISLTVPGLSLPVGISFYTFQALTYVIDVYRGKVPVQKSFYKLLLYVSMFPQLIAGPIVRYSEVDKQLSERTVTLNAAASGILRFSIGLIKKTVVANYAGKLCGAMLGDSLAGTSSVGAFVGLLAYTIQIYFDFSAYSDMAIGLGKMFGFDFPENFNYPYVADSVNDFWKRWHMTLSGFFKDYVYIPLGGNRRRWAFNMLLVWMLTGFWHGASWNYIVWGLYYFVFLMLEKLYIGERLAKLNPVIKHLYTLAVVMLGWAFFYFEDMSRLRLFFKDIFFKNGFLSLTDKTIIANYLLLLLVGIVFSMPVAKFVRGLCFRFSRKQAGKIAVGVLQTVTVAFCLLISTACLVGDSYNPFLYFRF
ncbi:MAG: MBOAT family protein [Clostridia bacterium]|nr:MBOAT family protein [Clostridia bacterium]